MYKTGDFIKDLAAFFTLPRGWDEGQAKGWAERLARELSGFDSEALKRAADQIIAKRTDTRLPPIADCIKACAEAKRWLAIERGSSQLPVGKTPLLAEYSEDRIGLANDLVNGKLGKQAAKEGWILSLHDFCRRTLRLPNDREVETCKRSALEFNKSYSECVKGGWREARALESLGAKMLKKRQALTDMVLHGVVK